MSLIRATPAVAVDWTKCFDYQKLIAEEIEHYSTVEVTADLKEGSVHANWAWIRWYQFLAARWQTEFLAEIVAAARRCEAPRLLSLGCGYGGMEMDVARRLAGPYEILAVDVNENLFRRVREEVAREGLHIEFRALDLNFAELAENSFDVVFAHASLHHLLNFEHLFAQVYRSLRDQGRFIMVDMIGKSQVLFWEENIRFATEIVARMPERYRKRLTVDPEAPFAAYLDGAEQQGMEGIRQEELEAQIERWFRPLRKYKYNSFVRLICADPEIAFLFDQDSADDREYLDSLYRLDLEQIAAGSLRPTEMLAVLEKRPRKELDSTDLGGWAELRDNPKVTTGVFCEGPATALRACLASLEAQTYRNLEIIVLLPAGCTEEIAELARQFAAAHAHVRLLPVGSMADGGDWRPVLDAATGEYIAFLSGHDAWYPIKLSTQVAFLEERPAIGLAYAQAIVVDDRGRRTLRVSGTDMAGEDVSGEALERLIEGYEPPRSTLLIRAACWRQLDFKDGDSVTEEDLWLRFAAGWQVGFQDRPLGMLRVPAVVLDETCGGTRRHRLAALEKLRRDAARLGDRLAEPAMRSALERRIAALGGTEGRRANGFRTGRLAGSRFLSRMGRLLEKAGLR